MIWIMKCPFICSRTGTAYTNENTLRLEYIVLVFFSKSHNKEATEECHKATLMRNQQCTKLQSETTFLFELLGARLINNRIQPLHFKLTTSLRHFNNHSSYLWSLLHSSINFKNPYFPYMTNLWQGRKISRQLFSLVLVTTFNLFMTCYYKGKKVTKLFVPLYIFQPLHSSHPWQADYEGQRSHRSSLPVHYNHMYSSIHLDFLS